MVYSSRVMTEWRQLPRVSPDTSPSPPTTLPTTPTSPPLVWRRLSTSSSKTPSSSSSSSSSSDWRSGSPPRPISNQAGRPPFMGVEDGDILYLPSTPIPSSSIMKKHPNQSNLENHPLVILGKRKEGGEEIVRVQHLTTFGGKTLETHKAPKHHHFFMICQNHQDMKTTSSNPVARMALGFEPLEKRSYINPSYNSLFEIEYKYLEAFTKSGLRRLDAESVAFIKNVRSSI